MNETYYSTAILKGTRDEAPETQFINRAYDMAEYELIRKGCSRESIERVPLWWIEPDEENELPGGWQVMVTASLQT